MAQYLQGCPCGDVVGCIGVFFADLVGQNKRRESAAPVPDDFSRPFPGGLPAAAASGPGGGRDGSGQERGDGAAAGGQDIRAD